MIIQYAYLKNFLNTKLSQKKLSDLFTQVGFECDIDRDLIEFDITPNRGDMLSLRGLEREFHAYQATKPIRKLKTFSLKHKKQEENIKENIKILSRKFVKEKTGKKPITNINLVRI